MNASIIGGLISGLFDLVGKGITTLGDKAGGNNERKTGWLSILTGLGVVLVPDGMREPVANVLLLVAKALGAG